MKKKLPLVALVGRPNVGKSTLFNRLLHKRRAITDPTPGVTRDPVEAEASIGGIKLSLADTGGFKSDTAVKGVNAEDAAARTGLEKQVRQRMLDYAEDADLIVLIFEAGELTPEDEELIEVLRPKREKILAVVNKTEGGRRENEAWNLLSYGFDSLVMISAEHGDRVGELEAAIAARLGAAEKAAAAGAGEAAAADEAAAAGTAAQSAKIAISVALLGKPNTGKSTLSNRLTSSAASIVSPVPGTTRDVIEGSFAYKNAVFTLFDTAGIRRRSKVTENIEYYSVNRALKAINEADVVFLMIDAEEGLTDQDKKIAAQACAKGCGVIFVLNKWDLVPKVKNAEGAVKDRIRYFFGQMEYAPIIPLCAKDGSGVDKLLDTALRMYRQLRRRTETSALNAALERWLEEAPPPQGPRTRFKVKYAVQVSPAAATTPTAATAPDSPAAEESRRGVKFVFFVSRPAAVTDAYKAYLRNKIRKDLGYSMIPVEIEIRPSRKERR